MFAQISWNAETYFRNITDTNRLARQLGLTFAQVSGLQGLEDCIINMQDAVGFIAMAESSDGLASIDITPNSRRVKTIFLALRHTEGDMAARNAALDQLRELFRQILSHILREKIRLHQQGIYLDPEIPFHEIEQYFATGCACAYFQLAYSTAIDLQFNPDEWT